MDFFGGGEDEGDGRDEGRGGSASASATREGSRREPETLGDSSSVSSAAASAVPLAERLRPKTFDDWVGQEELTGAGSFLMRLLETGAIPSLIFWGPPGCGKTTLARLIAAHSKLALAPLSAVTSGMKEVRTLIEGARKRLKSTGQQTILFIDEIHRFNKAQQDAFLPHVENGTIVLFGATTENPSFSVISPLLSRARVLVLKSLEPEALTQILKRALSNEEVGLGAYRAEIGDETLTALAGVCDGDARRALNLLEQCVAAARPRKDGTRSVDAKLLAEVSRRTHLLYDKTGEEHFNVISALHKSVRSSDPQAALYWLARMLAGGEDPLYVGRRLVRMASEDIGLADPQALAQALAGVETYRMLGSPEGELALAQVAVYLATAPKSNALYTAMNKAKQAIEETGSLGVPDHLRNAPTALMKDIGYGKGYQYDHDARDAFSGQQCLPDELEGTKFYEPGEFGFEKEIAKRLAWWDKRRGEIRGGSST